MLSLPVYDRSGVQVRTYEIDPAQLAPRISKQLLHDAVVMYQTNLRQGTVRTKNRSEVAGHHEEDVSAEGDRQRPGRLATQRHPPRRRAHPRHPAPRLVLPPDEEGHPPGDADGRGHEAGRQPGYADRRLEFREAADAGDGRHPQGPEDRRRQPVGGGGRVRRQRIQERPQPGRRLGGAGGGVDRPGRAASAAVADDHRRRWTRCGRRRRHDNTSAAHRIREGTGPWPETLRKPSLPWRRTRSSSAPW